MPFYGQTHKPCEKYVRIPRAPAFSAIAPGCLISWVPGWGSLEMIRNTAANPRQPTPRKTLTGSRCLVRVRMANARRPRPVQNHTVRWYRPLPQVLANQQGNNCGQIPVNRIIVVKRQVRNSHGVAVLMINSFADGETNLPSFVVPVYGFNLNHRFFLSCIHL